MFTAYFDASGSGNQGVALTVAGFVATKEQWVEFERNWKESLAAYQASCLHMKEFAPGIGEYASWKDDKEKRRSFLERLIGITAIRVRHCFASTVWQRDYSTVDKRYCLSERYHPFALAGLTCIQRVQEWAIRQGISLNEIAYVFEDGDKHKGNLIQRCEEIHHFVPMFEKKHRSCAFQAADLLAYESRRGNLAVSESGPGTLAMGDLRGALQALDRIPHGKDGEDWGFYDVYDLEQHCVMNNIPLRSAVIGG